MQEDLIGKVVLVTGSSRGLGRHDALHLARAAAFGEAASGPIVAAQIRATGRCSAFFAADLTEAAQVERLVRQVVEAFGHIDILVNNAGGDMGAHTPRPDPNDALDISPDDIRAVLERNLLTTCTCASTRACTCAPGAPARSSTWDQAPVTWLCKQAVFTRQQRHRPLHKLPGGRTARVCYHCELHRARPDL
jgi:NAD(P)-dependent dehydrogenase (short-subunit alcohol dehydrogenase family)